MGIKTESIERRKNVYSLVKILLKTRPKGKTMIQCFKEVATEIGYDDYRSVSNIYHDLKKKDENRLSNIKPKKS